MKKLLLTLVAVLFFNACSEKETLQGKNFVMDGNKNITISFDAKDNKFYGKAINNYFGTYKTDNNNITLSLTGSTMMAGPEEEMKKEQAYFNDLSKIKTYSLKNKTLELKGDNITIKYMEQ